jgi:hypothetical protein
MLTVALFLAVGVDNYLNAQTEKLVTVSLCDVLARPKAFSGKSMTMTVRITSTKEGTTLWNPACKGLGVDLQTDASARSQPGISALYQALRLHGLSDHPVIATVTGIFIYDQYDEVRHQRRSVVKATAATDIKQSDVVEHR